MYSRNRKETVRADLVRAKVIGDEVGRGDRWRACEPFKECGFYIRKTETQWSHPSALTLNISQHHGLFQMSQLFVSGGQKIRVSASTSVLPMSIQD